MRSTAVSALVALVLVLSAAPVGGEEPAELGPCGAPAAHPGGEWRSYGHDLSNSRTQPLEDQIGPDTVGDLDVAWVFDAQDHGGGDINTTPIVADGCLYVIPSSGNAYALNADTGEVVWQTEFDVTPGGYGGAVVGAPAVDGDRLIAILNRRGAPYLAALDRADGTVLWTTVIDETPSSISNASVTVHDGLAFVGFSGSPGGTPLERGGFAVVDTSDGEVLAKTWTIPDDDFEAGYGGASIWSTAAVDTDSRHAYVGAGNPHSDRVEHQHANAILKVDLDPERATFGEIVGAYKGNPDQYLDAGLDRQPACQDLPPVYYAASFDATCLQLDLDFGASPNLFTDSRGYTRVGALQKSGVYHVAYADTMQRAWAKAVGAPCFACNAASAAFDGERIYTAAAPPGQLWSLDRDHGEAGWLTPMGGGLHYYSVSQANGVVYTMHLQGTLNMYEAETGVPLGVRSLRFDGGRTAAGNGSSGVAIARNTVYAAATSGFVVAYRL